jgi:hypothetical protein
MQIYRPGMGKFSSQTISKGDEEGGEPNPEHPEEQPSKKPLGRSEAAASGDQNNPENQGKFFKNKIT